VAPHAQCSAGTLRTNVVKNGARMRRKTCQYLGFPLLVLGCFISHAAAQTQPKTSLDSLIKSLFDVHFFSQVAISPDGKRVAWSEQLSDAAGQGSSGIGIFVQELQGGGTPRRVSAGTGQSLMETNVTWSPDSSHIAFLSDAGGNGQTQLYVAAIDGSPARKLTSLTGFLDQPGWSPDGKQIALLFTENAPRAAGPLMPMSREVGVIESKVYEQRLTTVDASSGEVRQVSPADMYVYEYDWAPDSKSFAVAAAHGAGDDNWYVAELYTLALSGEMKSVYKPTLQIADPKWSPDGKYIAFIAGLMSDEGSTGGDIYIVPTGIGKARNLTSGIKASPSSLDWMGLSQIIFTATADGASEIASLDTSSGEVRKLWSGPESLSTGAWGAYGVSWSNDHKTSAVVRQSFSAPPEVWAGPIGPGWVQITHTHDSQHQNWGKTDNIHWNNDGMNIQGWLMYPREYDPAKHYPMVVEVHGGPGSAAHPAWPESFFDTSVLSSLGYFILYPKPRGSFGQGEAFVRGNVKDFGYGDFRDILAGVDYVTKNFPVDANRVGLTGWSYGGYMTMWGVTQTTRFRAAVAGAGIADWLSYYGQNDIDKWMPPFFGATVYDDPQVYARSSPITYIKRVKTPTLILVGEHDGECPTPQSREFWHALKAMNVPTQLVIYEGEGHFIAQAEHRRDIIERMVNWFDKYMPEK